MLLERTPKVCEVDCPSRHKETPLHMACLRGHWDMAEYLVSKGANPLAVESRGNTPVHYASSSSNAGLLQWLLGLGEDVKESVNRKNQVCVCVCMCMYVVSVCRYTYFILYFREFVFNS